MMMEQDVFRAGVRPGGPVSVTEIRMLLCFILSNLAQPMSFEQLYESLSDESLVNYFDLVGALERLQESGHIVRSAGEDGADRFENTELGRTAAREFTNTLPLAVRERALAAAYRTVERQKRLRELTVEMTPAGSGGFNMRLAIPEEGGELISLTLYAPNEEQCALIRRRFLNAPGFVYKGVLALLTGNREVLDELYPSPDQQLFPEDQAGSAR